MEVLPIGLAICDMDGRLTYVNPAYASIIGHTIKEAVELTYWQVTPKEYEEQELEQLKSLETTGRYGPYEKEYIHKDGHRIPVRLSGVLIRENDQDMIWSSVEDISISNTANELAAKTELLETTFENMADGISLVDKDLNLLAYNKRFLEVQRFPSDLFSPGDPLEAFVRFNAERGEYGPGDTETLVRDYLERARRCNPPKFERTSPDGNVTEIRRHPLPDGGFVTLYSDITDRKKTEEALRKSEDKFREFTSIATDWLWEMDSDLRFSYFSPRNKEITGFNPEIYIGKTRREIAVNKSDNKYWQKHLADLDAHRPFRNFEYDLKIASGRTITISIGGNPIFDDMGEFQGYLGTGSDVTERKQAEKAVRKSEARFKDFAASASDWLWETDPKGRIVWESESSGETAGLTFEEIKGMTRQEIAGEMMKPDEWLPYQTALDEHKDFRDFEYKYRSPAGKIHYTLITGKAIFDDEGNYLGHRGAATGISERKEAEFALQESEARFREFAEVSSDWLWEMDADLRFTYVSPRNKEITGLGPEYFIGKPRNELSAGSSDDENWRRHLEDLKSHREFRNFEYDIQIVDGRTLTISISGNPAFDEDGCFNGYYGTGRDITQRKQGEKSLRESEQRFRALYHQSPAGVTLEDYSQVKPRIDQLIKKGVTDLKKYFHEHDEELLEIVMEIQLMDANDTLIKMFGTSSFEELKEFDDDYEAWKDADWKNFYIGEFAAFAAGKHTYSDEYTDTQLDGTTIQIRCTSRIVSDHEDDWSEIITTHEDVTARKVAEEQLLLQATIDQVTGLPNRALLFDRLAQSIEHARREQRNVGLIFVDLDHFKQVNDTRGHAAGDHLLKLIGERLIDLVRHEDTVARLGGDEFIILLNDIDLPNGPEIVATKIIDSFTPPFDLNGIETFVTSSLGISIYPDDGEDAETLLQHADAAMYKSKRSGRNTFRFFTPGLNDQAEQHSRVAERLRHALDREDFKLYFQPVVDLRNDSVTAVEALIRWDDAVLKNVDTSQLIAVAEEAGFILPIEKWVLEEACLHVARWRDTSSPSLMLSVNVTRSNFRNPNFIDVVKNALGNSGLPAEALAIEIVETVLIEDSEKIIQRLNELSAMGVRLALDDFGTGYSSLAYLKRFKVNAIKIDQTFIKEIASNTADLSLVMAIIAMSRSLELAVVAEGVETLEQLELLQASGCHLIQGFHFSEPLSVKETTKYLSDVLPRRAEK